jgi:hypothetical protein
MITITDSLQSVARKVLDHALPIQESETVTFLAGEHNLDLAYAFAAECSVRGIESFIVTQPDYVLDAKLRDAPYGAAGRQTTSSHSPWPPSVTTSGLPPAGSTNCTSRQYVSPGTSEAGRSNRWRSYSVRPAGHQLVG